MTLQVLMTAGTISLKNKNPRSWLRGFLNLVPLAANFALAIQDICSEQLDHNIMMIMNNHCVRIHINACHFHAGRILNNSGSEYKLKGLNL